jgi:hypothetical protein
MTEEPLVVDGAPHVKLVRGDLSGLDSLAAEALAVFCFADVRPLAGAAGYLDWRVCGAISHRIENGAFSAEPDETLLLPTCGRLGRQRLFLFGLGPWESCDRPAMRRACRGAAEVMRRAGAGETVFVAPAVNGDTDVEREFVRAVEEELPSAVAAVLVELQELD